VLLDLNLPDSHGAETFRSVLNQAPGVPMVVLSGIEDQELSLRALHQGVQDNLASKRSVRWQAIGSLSLLHHRAAGTAACPRHEPRAARHSTPGGIGTLEDNSGSQQSRCVESCATSRNRENHRLSKAETLPGTFPGKEIARQVYRINWRPRLLHAGQTNVRTLERILRGPVTRDRAGLYPGEQLRKRQRTEWNIGCWPSMSICSTPGLPSTRTSQRPSIRRGHNDLLDLQIGGPFMRLAELLLVGKPTDRILICLAGIPLGAV
jgi:hypothetical protein